MVFKDGAWFPLGTGQANYEGDPLDASSDPLDGLYDEGPLPRSHADQPDPPTMRGAGWVRAASVVAHHGGARWPRRDMRHGGAVLSPWEQLGVPPNPVRVWDWRWLNSLFGGAGQFPRRAWAWEFLTLAIGPLTPWWALPPWMLPPTAPRPVEYHGVSCRICTVPMEVGTYGHVQRGECFCVECTRENRTPLVVRSVWQLATVPHSPPHPLDKPCQVHTRPAPGFHRKGHHAWGRGLPDTVVPNGTIQHPGDVLRALESRWGTGCDVCNNGISGGETFYWRSCTVCVGCMELFGLDRRPVLPGFSADALGVVL